MKEIKLTQNQIALVDDEDFDRINQYKWCAYYSPNTRSFYSMRGYNNRNFYMHRFIINAQNGENVDHKNHNTLDNRKENLRLCNNTTNQQNKRKTFNNKTIKYEKTTYNFNIFDSNPDNSGNDLLCFNNRNYKKIKYKGVHFNKYNNKWRVRISLNNKLIHLGYFNTEEIAALAYNEKAKELFGDFCYMNEVK